MSNVQLFRKDERHQLDAHLQRLRLNERRLAELRVVANGELIRSHAARQDAQPKIAYLHWPPQSAAQGRFNPGAKGVHVDHKRQSDRNHEQKGNDDANDLEGGFHGRPPCGLDSTEAGNRRRGKSIKRARYGCAGWVPRLSPRLLSSSGSSWTPAPSQAGSLSTFVHDRPVPEPDWVLILTH